MSRLPKILFVGLGDHARDSHLKHLVKMDIHPEIGVYDMTPDVLDISGRPDKDGEVRTPRMRAAEHGKTLTFMGPDASTVSLSAAYDAALEWADAVMICTPDHLHIEQMERAVHFGCHVFCEKPLATTPHEIVVLETIFQNARDKGVSVTSCHPRRFDPPYQNLKDCLPYLVTQFGPLMEVKLDFSYHTPSKTGLHGGSMLQDHANHEIDYLMWLVGVSGFTAYKLHDEEDRYHLSGIRTDGVIFHFGGTRRLNASIYPETIWLRFERGEMFVDTKERLNSSTFDHERRERISFDVGVTDYDIRFGDMNAHWLRLIAGEETNYLTEEQMLINSRMSVHFQKHDSLTIA